MSRRKSKIKYPKIGRKVCYSKFEYDIYKELKNEVPPKTLVEYEVDKLPYTIEGNYTPDFTITKKDGTVIFVEAKGLGRAFDATARRKMVAVRKAHPEKDIRIVFYSDRPITRGGKMRPSDWAIKYGYKFSIGSVPKGWFNE